MMALPDQVDGPRRESDHTLERATRPLRDDREGGVGAGMTEASRDGLTWGRSLYIACEGCGAFVRLKDAQKVARRAGAACIRPGDGCCCVTRTQRTRFYANMLERVTAVRDGDGVLIRTPDSLVDTTRTRINTEDMIRAAVAALELIPSATHARSDGGPRH